MFYSGASEKNAHLSGEERSEVPPHPLFQCWPLMTMSTLRRCEINAHSCTMISSSHRANIEEGGAGGRRRARPGCRDERFFRSHRIPSSSTQGLAHPTMMSMMGRCVGDIPPPVLRNKNEFCVVVSS